MNLQLDLTNGYLQLVRMVCGKVGEKKRRYGGNESDDSETRGECKRKDDVQSLQCSVHSECREERLKVHSKCNRLGFELNLIFGNSENIEIYFKSV